MNRKPRRVTAVVTRTVTELATVTLTRHGEFDEYIETLDEIELLDIEVKSIRTVLSEHD